MGKGARNRAIRRLAAQETVGHPPEVTKRVAKFVRRGLYSLRRPVVARSKPNGPRVWHRCPEPRPRFKEE